MDSHDFLDLLPPGIGRLLRGSYAFELKVAPWAWGGLLRALERHRSFGGLVGRLFARAAARRTRAVIGPDTAAVVSTYPLASQALGGLRAEGAIGVPVVTFLTDMSVHPLWIGAGVDLHLALHPVAAAQARRHGAAAVEVCGPLVGPAFRPARSAEERQAERIRFGLPPDRPVALVVAGSWGVGEVEQTAREIAASGLAVPVTLCGRNSALLARLLRGATGIPLGWVEDMPALLRSADLVVQNAGGLTSLEALASGVPVLSYRCLPGHGITNAAALHEAGLATWVPTPAALPQALRAALAAGNATATLAVGSTGPSSDRATSQGPSTAPTAASLPTAAPSPIGAPAPTAGDWPPAITADRHLARLVGPARSSATQLGRALKEAA
ncbi:glycosyltransferase [Kitasatospora sp. MMS16-BH015]|uniref:MGDG synthase family glycosyltransferase n=1 Tax=Kitasatospora sp. MMS16-BH015 TaxID=2018025 RepID=UPI0020C2F807|nr:glycosyltransferase [Kitasatospora sp. MMS16-BH015]